VQLLDAEMFYGLFADALHFREKRALQFAAPHQRGIAESEWASPGYGMSFGKVGKSRLVTAT
jgi:hypothetical protein